MVTLWMSSLQQMQMIAPDVSNAVRCNHLHVIGRLRSSLVLSAVTPLPVCRSLDVVCGQALCCLQSSLWLTAVNLMLSAVKLSVVCSQTFG